jgi:hypothetical protein
MSGAGVRRTITEQSKNGRKLLPLLGERAGVREIVKLFQRKGTKMPGRRELHWRLDGACVKSAVSLEAAVLRPCRERL